MGGGGRELKNRLDTSTVQRVKMKSRARELFTQPGVSAAHEKRKETDDGW